MKEKQVIQEAFTELSSHYEETIDRELNAFWGWNYQKFIDQLIDRTEIQENQQILDIATGTSVIPRKIIIKNIPGIHITGLDITESMLRIGKQKISASEFNSSISLTCGDAMALPFSDQSFDIVVSGLASHHMDIPLMLSEMKRVIKPGGMLSIIDVAISPIWEYPVVRGAARIGAFLYFLFKENLTRARAEFDAPINVRTPEGWQTELETAGFQSIKVVKLPSKNSWMPEPLAIQSIN